MLYNPDSIFSKRKLGKFKVPLVLLEEGSDKLKEALGKVIILEATNHFHDSTVEYFGVSELFREVAEGEEIPSYRVICTSDGVAIFEEVKRNEI